MLLKESAIIQKWLFWCHYRRLDTNELVVVHRGTEFETRQDREADMRMVKSHTNPQYNDARALTEVANAMAKHNGAKIYQTGHSLGGALAQLCGNRYSHRTETFNAFGAAGLKEALPINPLADTINQSITAWVETMFHRQAII